MKLRNKIVAIGLPLLLISCSSIPKTSNIINHRDNEYLKEQTIPTIKIPPGTNHQEYQTLYPVPAHTDPLAPKKVRTLPPGLTS
jgi:uncharacterized lipoprotein